MIIDLFNKTIRSIFFFGLDFQKLILLPFWIPEYPSFVDKLNIDFHRELLLLCRTPFEDELIIIFEMNHQ